MDRNTIYSVEKIASSKLAARGALHWRILLSVLVILGAADGFGQTTYTWTGGGGVGNGSRGGGGNANGRGISVIAIPIPIGAQGAATAY